MLNNELVRGFCYIEQSHASCSLMLKLYANQAPSRLLTWVGEDLFR